MLNLYLELRSSKRKLILDDFISIRKTLGIPGVYKRTAESILLKAYNSVNENTFKIIKKQSLQE